MNKKSNESFKGFIQKKCVERHINFEKFLHDLNISINDLSEWRNSNKYHIKTLMIAEYLNISPDILFGILKLDQQESSVIYNRIKGLCESKGSKISPYLSKLGYDSRMVSDWKNRTSINIDILKKLSEEFDCSIDYLVGLTDDTHSNHFISTDTNLKYFVDEFLGLDTFQQIDVFNYIEFLKYKVKQISDAKQAAIPIEIPEKYKEIVDMREHGMTMAQIAIAKNTTKQNVSLILKKCKK